MLAALPLRSLSLWFLVDGVSGQGGALTSNAGLSVKQRLFSLEKKSYVVRNEVVHGRMAGWLDGEPRTERITTVGTTLGCEAVRLHDN